MYCRRLGFAETIVQQKLSFDAWKARLREDCARQDKLLAFHCLGDYILAIFWKNNVEPSAEAISKDKTDISSAA
jgi:hypothetical protein